MPYYTRLIFQKYDIHPSNLANTILRYKAKSLDCEKIGYCDLHFFGQRSHHYDSLSHSMVVIHQILFKI